MSRSNPESNNPHPCKLWLEWDGAKGIPRHYDREKKENVSVTLPIEFVVLDKLSTVKGWNEASESSIYSNEIHDTRLEPMTVKSFKGGVIAEGLYSDIREKAISAGGHFVLNIYIAIPDIYATPDTGSLDLTLGSLQLKGAALGAWMDFEKDNRKAIMSKGVTISGATKGKKGAVTYYTPSFVIQDVSDDVNLEAMELDKQLQEFFRNYFKRGSSRTNPQPDEKEINQELSADRPELLEAERPY